jgi:hypothetical protein
MAIDSALLHFDPCQHVAQPTTVTTVGRAFHLFVDLTPEQTVIIYCSSVASSEVRTAQTSASHAGLVLHICMFGVSFRPVPVTLVLFCPIALSACLSNLRHSSILKFRVLADDIGV